MHDREQSLLCDGKYEVATPSEAVDLTGEQYEDWKNNIGYISTRTSEKMWFLLVFVM